MEKLHKDSKITLNNGIQIPVIGFGVFRIADGDEVERSVLCALKAGYRHIDAALIYKNEKGVGKAIQESGITREELFITTKLWNSDQGYENALKAIDVSLQNLGLSYIDLYLIHWPTASEDLNESMDKREETWKAMEEIYKSGKVKAIGVSNFTITHLEEMKKYATVLPIVNQVEFHPFLYQKELLAYCKKHNIVVEAHSPLAPIADEKSIPYRNDTIDVIAQKYGKSGAQLLIRWSIQHGIIPLPKSTHEERILENINVFDFTIKDEDMEKLNSMNINLHVRRDPTNLK